MQPIWHVPWVDRLRSRYGVLEGSACCAVEQFLCQSDGDCVRLHIQTHAEWQPASQSLSAAQQLSLSSFYLCHFLFPFSVVVVCLPFPVLTPSPTSSFYPSPCSFSLAVSLCFQSEWYRRSVLGPHSSLWQPQLPDKRKQIPQHGQIFQVKLWWHFTTSHIKTWVVDEQCWGILFNCH